MVYLRADTSVSCQNFNNSNEVTGLTRKGLAFAYWLKAQGVRLKDKKVIEAYSLTPYALCL